MLARALPCPKLLDRRRWRLDIVAHIAVRRGVAAQLRHIDSVAVVIMSAVLAGSFLSPCLICPTASALITAVTARIAALWHVLCSPALSNPSPTRSKASPRAALMSKNESLLKRMVRMREK